MGSRRIWSRQLRVLAESSFLRKYIAEVSNECCRSVNAIGAVGEKFSKPSFFTIARRSSSMPMNFVAEVITSTFSVGVAMSHLLNTFIMFGRVKSRLIIFLSSP